MGKTRSCQQQNLGFRRELDFRTGELRREFVWETKKWQTAQDNLFTAASVMQTKELGLPADTLYPAEFFRRAGADRRPGFFGAAPHVRAEFLGLPAQ